MHEPRKRPRASVLSLRLAEILPSPASLRQPVRNLSRGLQRRFQGQGAAVPAGRIRRREIATEMGAPAFAPAQRGDGNQQRDECRVRCRAGRSDQRQQSLRPPLPGRRVCAARRPPATELTEPPPDQAAAGILTAMPSRSRPGGAAATLAATDPAPTTASSSELLARRLAPCSPVPATSPHAHRPGTRATSVPVHRDAAHVVMRGRTHRDRLRRGIDPGASRRQRR